MTDAPEEVGTFRFTGTRWARDDPTGDGTIVVRRGDVVTVYDHEYDAVKLQLEKLDIGDDSGADDEHVDDAETEEETETKTYAEDGYDADAFAELGYQERVAAVRNGLVDDGLDEIIDTDGSSTVVDAANDRKETLGE